MDNRRPEPPNPPSTTLPPWAIDNQSQHLKAAPLMLAWCQIKRNNKQEIKNPVGLCNILLRPCQCETPSIFLQCFLATLWEDWALNIHTIIFLHCTPRPSITLAPGWKKSICVWVTQPERPDGAKDKVKQARSQSRRTPWTSSFTYTHHLQWRSPIVDLEFEGGLGQLNYIYITNFYFNFQWGH